MMNILTVFNIIPDLDLISEAEWASDIVDTRLNFPGVKTVPEAQDESAAELALRFRDAAAAASADSVAAASAGSHASAAAAAIDSEVRLTAVTFGNAVADKTLRTLTALGYQSADRIDTDRPGPDNEESHAALLAEYCRKRGPFDLILSGTQSGVSGFSQLPLLLAEALQFPCITEVTGFSAGAEGRIRIEHQTDTGILSEDLPTPLLLTIGDVPDTCLRIPTLRQRKASGSNPPSVISASEFSEELKENGIRLQSVSTIDQSRAARQMEGDTDDIAKQIVQEYIREGTR
ncbi:electron transfer flavoprotein subunit beta/FixA family protein [Hornefia butyriciproducens]|uniref:electron transfer flavoprotein subunit beta/FixA family protein n=1 Tax=Hornefia butyriciproducens TaxID=2652293 RepID=UPI003D00D54E